MLPPKLARLFEEMETVREKTLSALSVLTDADFQRSTGGEWSAAQLLAHILLSETGTSKVIRKAIKTAGGSLPPYPADDSGISLRRLERAPGSYQAPDAVQPGTPPEKEELFRQARETREQTAASFALLATVDPRAATFPHPLFGDLNLYEWPAATILAHERDHQAQIRDLSTRLDGTARG